MTIEIKIPSVGESVKEAVLAQWYKQDGDTVTKGEPLFVIETDKITLEIEAEADGVLRLLVAEGETVAIGTLVGRIEVQEAAATAPAPVAEPPPAKETPPAQPPAEAAPTSEIPSAAVAETQTPAIPLPAESPIMQDQAPSVRRLVREHHLDVSQLTATGPGGRLTKGDVILYLEGLAAQAPAAPSVSVAGVADDAPTALETRKPMSPIRRRIAARLLEAKQNTAMLTTFNEIDMSQVMAVRTRYKEAFKDKYGVSLGFMSFFIKASIAALLEYPQINSFIDGEDIIEHNYCHIGVAIGSGRGLVVPVIRHAERLNFAELEQAIVDFVTKIKANQLQLDDLEGGTFTISNGGVYGSLLSTPILNTPQSGILGMHKIEKRAVVVDDQIVVRPMMYVALSYDHRIVDGREAVSCLKRIKECIENPERMMMEI
jgi:2-oxoglutarate dehydrogenase E2 component (dihydrolipoamide succinyltransferase)